MRECLYTVLETLVDAALTRVLHSRLFITEYSLPLFALCFSFQSRIVVPEGFYKGCNRTFSSIQYLTHASYPKLPPRFCYSNGITQKKQDNFFVCIFSDTARPLTHKRVFSRRKETVFI